MGSPVSFVVANLVMKIVEKRALSTFHPVSKILKRCVDSIFVIINKNSAEGFFRSFKHHWKINQTCNRKRSQPHTSFLIRAGVSVKIFETETRHWRCETETLSKNSRRDRNLNEPRPRQDTKLLKPNVCNVLQIFLTLNFGHSVNFPTQCYIDFWAFRYYIRNKLIKKVILLNRYTFVFN